MAITVTNFVDYDGTDIHTQALDHYPIGSVYETITNTNPGTFLGGTWELIAKNNRSYTVSGSQVVSMSATSDSVLFSSVSNIRSRFKSTFNFEDAYVNTIGPTNLTIIVSNGDGTANTTHIHGTTWMGNNLYVFFSSANSKTIRVNYTYIFTENTNATYIWRRTS